MPNFWKPVKPAKKQKPVKLVKLFYSPTLKKYPIRTSKEIRTISMHPSRDADKDGVMNWFDCKPLSKQWQDVLFYHGTSKHAARKIKQEGLKRQHSITGHVFLTSKKHIARRYAGEEGTVLAVSLPDELVKESTGGPIHKEATTQVMVQKDIHPKRIRELKQAEEGYPSRTRKEQELADERPWEDTDKDGVLNYFDCRPLNERLQERIPIIKLPPTRFPNIPPRAREVIPQRPRLPAVPSAKPKIATQAVPAPVQQTTTIASLPYKIVQRESEEVMEEEEKESKEEARESREVLKEEMLKLEEQKRIKREEERLERQIKEDKELEEKEMRKRKKRRRRKKHLAEY